MSEETKAEAKTAYERKAEAKLEEARAKIDTVKAQVKGAVAESEIRAAKELESAEGQLNAYLEKAEQAVGRIKASGEEAWEELTDEVEDAWENISQSLKRFADKFTDKK